MQAAVVASVVVAAHATAGLLLLAGKIVVYVPVVGHANILVWLVAYVPNLGTADQGVGVLPTYAMTLYDP